MFRARSSTADPANPSTTWHHKIPCREIGCRAPLTAELLILETISANDIVTLTEATRAALIIGRKKMTRRRSKKRENIVSEALIATHFSSAS
jgi:hypothetical protein